MPKVDFREEVANVALAELLEQRGLSEGRYVANVVDGKGTNICNGACHSRSTAAKSTRSRFGAQRRQEPTPSSNQSRIK